MIELNDAASCINSVRSVRAASLRDEPFWGTVAMKLKICPCESHGGEEIDTLATDGHHLFVNPDYFKSKLPDERKTAILHEVAHVALCHPLRRMGRDPELFNIACDLAVNIWLKDSGYAIPEEWYCEERYRGWSAERIYADRLPKKQPKGKPPQGGRPGGKPSKDKGGQTITGGEKKDPDKNGQPGPAGPAEKKEAPKKILPGKLLDSKNPDGSEMKNKDKEKAMKDHARDMEYARMVERTAGVSPDAVTERIIDAVVTPATDWRSLLNSFWSDVGEKSGETWRRFNRRAMMAGMWMPDQIRNRIDHIVIPLDISSSVGRDEQAAFLDKIEQLRKDTPCRLLTIIPFNHVVQRDQIVEVLEYEDVPTTWDVGGGTRFASVFNYIGRMDKCPDAVIVFTDLGCSDYGEPPGCRVLWASSEPVYERGNYSNRPPFGDVIEVEVV